jgi:hypothetical protein
LFPQAEDDHIRSASAFLLASRGAWSLGIFLMANWLEISTFFRNQRRGASITAGGRAPPPKEEQVRCTAIIPPYLPCSGATGDAVSQYGFPSKSQPPVL